MHSSLKPPLSSNFPAVYKLGFLFCGGGGTAFFKKDQIVGLHPEEPTDAGPGQSRLTGADWFGSWVSGRTWKGSSSLSLPRSRARMAFPLHSSLMPSADMAATSFLPENFLSQQ